MDYGGNDTL